MKTKPLYGNIIDHSQHMNLTVYEDLLEFHSTKWCILLRFPQSSLWILVLFFRRQTQPWISVDFSPSGCWPVMFPWGCTVGGAVMANNSVSSAASYDLFGCSSFSSVFRWMYNMFSHEDRVLFTLFLFFFKPLLTVARVLLAGWNLLDPAKSIGHKHEKKW